MAWDEPAILGGGPILGYRVEQATNSTLTEWEILSETGPSPRQIAFSWCAGGGVVRVSARNRCGWGAASGGFGNWIFSAGTTHLLLTGSSTFQPPCWSTSVKVWCIGCGGTSTSGGGGGGMAWKTWTRLPQDSWGSLACVVRNTADANGSALCSATYGGATVIAYGGVGAETGGYLGGDGGAYGNPGGNGYQAYSGQPYASITYPFTGTVQYSGNYTFGGGIGGQTGTNPDGTAIRPLPVSPCRRHPAVDRSGLFAAVSLLGQRVIEECEAEAAFGSGGVTFTIPGYSYGGGRVDFSPGYGGGGFDATNPGKPGVIVVKYS